MADPDRPTLEPPPMEDPHERPTLTQCQACKGNFLTEARDDADVNQVTGAGKKPSGTFSFVQCRWCSSGLMTQEQLERWMEHERQRAAR